MTGRARVLVTDSSEKKWNWLQCSLEEITGALVAVDEVMKRPFGALLKSSDIKTLKKSYSESALIVEYSQLSTDLAEPLGKLTSIVDEKDGMKTVQMLQALGSDAKKK